MPTKLPAFVSDEIRNDPTAILFGPGFWQDEGSWRWMSKTGYIHVKGHHKGFALSFNLVSGKAENYDQLPFDVQISVNSGQKKNVSITAGEELHLVQISVHTDSDILIVLQSNESFKPSSRGSYADTRELSIRTSDFVIQPLDVLNARAGNAGLKGSSGESRNHPADTQSPEYANSAASYIEVRSPVTFDNRDEAIRLLEEFIGNNPDHALAHNHLAGLYTNAGDAGRGQMHYEAAVRLEPQNIAFLKNLAEYSVSVECHMQRAAQLYQDVLTLQPGDKEALNALALLAVVGGREEEATLLFSKVLNLQPDAPAVYKMIQHAKEQSADCSAVYNNEKSDRDLKIVKISSLHQYHSYVDDIRTTDDERRLMERNLISEGATFTVRGICAVCSQIVDFAVVNGTAETQRDRQVPNWRESLNCPTCGLNNRIRAAIHIGKQYVHKDSSIYMPEATTATFRRMNADFPSLIGSEYFGNGAALGSEIKGIRNEDLTKLTFIDESFDFIMSLDIFEHIPDIAEAFKECFRVLKRSGSLLFSVPFRRDLEKNLVRSILRPDGTIEHLLPPEIHGNPIHPSEGSLCFYHFGWEVLAQIKSAGFESADALLYWSRDYCYLGGNQILFLAKK